MLLNLKKLQKKDGTPKKENKIKKYIKRQITSFYGEMDFIETFVEISILKKWTWATGPITVDTVIDNLVDYTYKIVKSELDYFSKYNKWYKDAWLVAGVGSGRLMVRPVDFEETRHRVWLDVEFSTTL